jgi:serine/threonine protein kinase
MDAYNEFAIGMMLNEFVKSGMTKHLPRTYDLIACDTAPSTKLRYFMVMEFIKKAITIGTVRDDIDEWGEGKNDMTVLIEQFVNARNAIMIQVLHTLHLMNMKRIMHNDLHQDNVILTRSIEESPEMFGGKEFRSYDYFAYQIGTKTLYIPRREYIFVARIIDFGYSCEYDGRGVCSGSIGADSFVHFFTPIYDCLVFLQKMLLFPVVEQPTYPKYMKLVTSSRAMLLDFIEFIFGRRFEMYEFIGRLDAYDRFVYGGAQEMMRASKVTPADILLRFPLFAPYRVRPPATAKVLVMATDKRPKGFLLS